MSHIVQIKTEVRDRVAIKAACTRNKLPTPTEGTAQLFSAEATGIIVQLPNWKYPVVCNTESGQIAFDNYQGRWGDQQHLDKFLQSYAVEKTRLVARQKGHSVLEQPQRDGSIKLLIQVGGVA